MSANKWILWIDDNPNRKRWADKLDAAMKPIKVVFQCVKDVDIDEALQRHLDKKTAPRLVLIDHILDKVAADGFGISRGSTVAGLLRETWQECPIIGVTAHANMPNIELERFAYDELVDQDRFATYISYVPQVIEGFEKCRRIRSLDGFVKLLGTPAVDTERLKACLPHEIKKGVTEGRRRFSSTAYHWIRERFYKLPGFLYDKMWVATQLGIKDKFIDEYIRKLGKAEYKGIYRDSNDRRWWKSRILEQIYSAGGAEALTVAFPQQIAVEVLKVPKKKQSVCYACNEPWPETVGYIDESEGASAKQLHLRCTVAHPLHSYQPMFEEARVMESEK